VRLLTKFTLANLLCFTVFSAVADDFDDDSSDRNGQTLVQYIKNLGEYLGFDLTQDPTANGQSQPISSLIDIKSTASAQISLWNTFFGAIPIASTGDNKTTQFQFVSETMNGADAINKAANYTFQTQAYSIANSSDASNPYVTANCSLDQPNKQSTFQDNPVSQSILNILATPDVSVCTDTQGNILNPCSIKYQNQIINNVIGPEVPATSEFYTPDYNQKFLGQLNSESLIAPLYFTTIDNGSSTGSSTGTPKCNGPLNAQNQAQQAANFIRYVSGSLVPLSLPKQKEYDDLYTKTLSSTATPAQKLQAQTTLSTYLANLRIYAAQSSVGLGNLYYILSKRLPQIVSDGDKKNVSSQASNEFYMASKRLQPASDGNPSEWMTKINSASSATVQKEIAVLLAEMNYQMYLERQLQERILLTNSVMLMQNTRASQPSANFSQNTTPTGQ
jgi:intracellular multiplication protein IcmX